MLLPAVWPLSARLAGPHQALRRLRLLVRHNLRQLLLQESLAARPRRAHIRCAQPCALSGILGALEPLRLARELRELRKLPVPAPLHKPPQRRIAHDRHHEVALHHMLRLGPAELNPLDQVVQHGAQRKLLRGGAVVAVPGRAAGRVLARRRCAHAAVRPWPAGAAVDIADARDEVEVGEHEVVARVEQHVGRPQVAVHQPMARQPGHGLGHLGGPPANGGDGLEAALVGVQTLVEGLHHARHKVEAGPAEEALHETGRPIAALELVVDGVLGEEAVHAAGPGILEHDVVGQAKHPPCRSSVDERVLL